MTRFEMVVGKDGTDEMNFKSNDKLKLVKLGKEYSQKGYFVFLSDSRNNEFVEIRHIDAPVLDLQKNFG